MNHALQVQAQVRQVAAHRAPSNTDEPSQTLWSIAPNSGVLPSVHCPLK
jgi:hypothetical protein